jgi:hypothetical protein
MQLCGNSDEIGESTLQFPFASGGASSSSVICPEQVYIIDRICGHGAQLSAVSASVRIAIEGDNLDSLKTLRLQFDAIRKAILDGVCELSQHRIARPMSDATPVTTPDTGVDSSVWIG